MNQVELQVGIREAYKRLKPGTSAYCTVHRLLQGIPKQHLLGLKTVVLTDSDSLSHDRKRHKSWFRGRKVLIREANGLYHEASRGEQAWIELFVDNLTRGWPSWMFRVALLSDMAYARVLFHELGHHIHTTQAPKFSEPEDMADYWKANLTRHYFRHRYWYLVPLLLPVAFGFKVTQKAWRNAMQEKRER
jgi:hypothetical protein